MRTRRVVGVLAAVLAVGFGSASAEVFMKQVRKGDAHQIMGQQVEATQDTAMIWLAEDKARMDAGDKSSVLLRMDKGVLYMIDHEDRTYVEMPLDQSKMLDAMTEGQDPEQAQMMKSMMQNMMSGITVTVTPTDERKQVREWNARKYMVEVKMPMGTAKSEIWASPDVKVDPKLFQRMSMALSGQMFDTDKMMQEMQKIEGMEVMSTSTVEVMGQQIKSSQELVDFDPKAAPPAAGYDLPNGYEKTSMMQQ